MSDKNNMKRNCWPKVCLVDINPDKGPKVQLHTGNTALTVKVGTPFHRSSRIRGGKGQIQGSQSTVTSKNDEKKVSTHHKCRICEKSLAGKKSFNNHMAIIHLRDKEFRCDICERLCFSALALRAHKKIHEDAKYSCDICKKCFKAKTTLTTHMIGIHLKSQPRTKCDLCGKLILTSGLKNHINHFHKNIRKFQCEVQECRKSFKTAEHLRRHLATVHLKIKNHVCSICDRKFSNKGDLTIHIEKIHEHKRHNCQKCSRIFTLHYSLMDHLKTHETKPFSCLLCVRMFKTEKQLNLHLRNHEMQYQCDYCEAKYTDKQYLKNHLFKKHFKKP